MIQVVCDIIESHSFKLVTLKLVCLCLTSALPPEFPSNIDTSKSVAKILQHNDLEYCYCIMCYYKTLVIS